MKKRMEYKTAFYISFSMAMFAAFYIGFTAFRNSYYNNKKYECIEQNKCVDYTWPCYAECVDCKELIEKMENKE